MIKAAIPAETSASWAGSLSPTTAISFLVILGERDMQGIDRYINPAFKDRVRGDDDISLR